MQSADVGVCVWEQWASGEKTSGGESGDSWVLLRNGITLACLAGSSGQCYRLKRKGLKDEIDARRQETVPHQQVGRPAGGSNQLPASSSHLLPLPQVQRGSSGDAQRLLGWTQTPMGQLCTKPACEVWVTWLQSGFWFVLREMCVGTCKSEGR